MDKGISTETELVCIFIVDLQKQIFRSLGMPQPDEQRGLGPVPPTVGKTDIPPQIQVRLLERNFLI